MAKRVDELSELLSKVSRTLRAITFLRCYCLTMRAMPQDEQRREAFTQRGRTRRRIERMGALERQVAEYKAIAMNKADRTGELTKEVAELKRIIAEMKAVFKLREADINRLAEELIAERAEHKAELAAVVSVSKS